jgi:hypothetical protein
LNNTIIVVNDEPYCVWEVDPKERNKEFFEGIDEGYFDYIVNTHLATEDEKRASISLRIAFHHSLETMFSLLGAYIQAPDCGYAWLAKCSNSDLRSIVKRISLHDNTLFTKLNIQDVSWEAIAQLIFQTYLPGTEKNNITTKMFAQLWRRLAHEFIDENHIAEYNSLKHGFRVKAGGFGLAVGVEHQYGVPPPEEGLQVIGHSDYGTTFYKLETIGDAKGNRSLRSRRVSLNWTVERVTLLIQLVSMSITNITSAIKIANGAKPEANRFVRPTQDSDFEKPWTYSPGVTVCNFDCVIDSTQVVPVTKHELLKEIEKFKRS